MNNRQVNKISVSATGSLNKSSTLLARHFFYFILATVCEFVFVYVLLWNYGKRVCNDTSYKRETWTQNVNIFVSGAFLVNVVLHATRLNSGVVFSEHHNIKSTLYAVLTVNSIAACSAMTTAFAPNGTCTDSFGVQMNAEIYPEWLATVPLLGFMAISVDGKTAFDFNDKVFLASLFLNIFFGGIRVFHVFHGELIGFYLCFSSFVAFLIFMYIAEVMIGECHKILSDNPFLPSNSFKVHLASRKLLLLRFLTLLFPVFPLIYFLMLFHVIDANSGDALLMAASAISKMVFASLCTDAKLEITHPSAYANDMKTKLNMERRTFLRYIFHEIRVPLNSISLGIQYMLDYVGMSNQQTAADSNMRLDQPFTQMSSSSGYSSSTAALNRYDYVHTDIDSVGDMSDRSHGSQSCNTADEDPRFNQTLVMMDEASKYMSQVLNDVFSIHKIEEGVLRLNRKPFSMESLLHLAIEPFLHTIEKNKIQFKLDLDDNIPVYVKGDKYQLNHIVAKLLFNAIRFSKKRGKVSITVRSPGEPYHCDVENHDAKDPNVTEYTQALVRDYIIEVRDEGPGMTDEMKENIFNPYTKMRAGNIDGVGRGTGLGLAVCKEIIKLHKGALNCDSVMGKGTTFTIQVPRNTHNIQ